MVALARSRRRPAARREQLPSSPTDVLAGLDARRRSACRRNISTTATGSRCSSASPSCRNIIRPAARCRSCATTRGDIATLIPQGAALVEFGSGSSKKARILLARAAARSPPMCRSISAARCSSRKRPNCGPISPASRCCRCRRLHASRSSCRKRRKARRCASASFPGSTIGNFEPHEAAAFLRHAGRILGAGATLIVGVDLVEAGRGAQRRL